MDVTVIVGDLSQMSLTAVPIMHGCNANCVSTLTMKHSGRVRQRVINRCSINASKENSQLIGYQLGPFDACIPVSLDGCINCGWQQGKAHVACRHRLKGAGAIS